MSISERINLEEAKFFYLSPDTLIDNSGLESFGLIKSTVDVLVYYGIENFSADEIKALFEAMQLVRKKTGKVYIPSAKKISGVLECYLKKGRFQLEQRGNLFRVISWDCSGYRFEIEAAKRKGFLK